eukprot:2111841-Pleurochrysis_carterae.AAC.1
MNESRKCEMQHEQNTQRRTCEISCAIDSVIQVDNNQNATQDKQRKAKIMGNVGYRVMFLAVLLGMYIGRIHPVWFTKTETEDTRNLQGAEEDRKRKRATKAETQDRKKLLQRRAMQRRIRIWCKACRKKYDGKDRMKYRHKVRASKRWLRMRSPKEAWKANSREHKNRAGKPRDKDMKRRGGAGGCGTARTVNASNIEEEILNDDVGVPQQTWGDGSCWLWAVAGALNKLEGSEFPTENDLQLEKEWRKAIQDIVRIHGIPMSEEDLQGLREGVQYTQGRLTKGGTWGGGTEHQALAMLLRVNIIIWDRRHIGKVGTHHKQLYLCTPRGQTFIKNVTETASMIRQ